MYGVKYIYLYKDAEAERGRERERKKSWDLMYDQQEATNFYWITTTTNYTIYVLKKTPDFLFVSLSYLFIILYRI